MENFDSFIGARKENINKIYYVMRSFYDIFFILDYHPWFKVINSNHSKTGI